MTEKTVEKIPKGYEGVTPYMIFDDCAAAIDFYKKAFGAAELMRMPAPDGKIGHAEIRFEGKTVMLADEHPEAGARSLASIGGSPIGLMIYVEDVDAFVNRARQAGAELEGEVEDKFYGDRMGTLTDPFGYRWFVATHVEDVSEEEMRKRAQAQCPDKSASNA